MHRILRFSTAALITGLFFTGCATNEVSQTVAPNNRICVEFDTPNPGWIVGIQEVRVDDMDRLHVYAETKLLANRDSAVAQVITQAGDCIRVERNGREVITYLAGATWKWTPDGVIKVDGLKDYSARIANKKTKKIFPNH